MLGITRILREAHARGECRWGCPGCAEEQNAFKNGDHVVLAKPDDYHLHGQVDGWVPLDGFDVATGTYASGYYDVTFHCADGTIEPLWVLARDMVLAQEEDAKAVERAQEPAEEQEGATGYHRFDLLWAWFDMPVEED